MSEQNESGTEGKFEGFERPCQNYSKLPHEWIPHIAEMSLSELKVMLYILRHTWGYSEFNKPKRISLDEFEHGRWKRDRTRIDCGTGLSRPSIVGGLRKAVDHQYLQVVKSKAKNNTIQNSYCLKMLEHTPQTCSKKSLLEEAKILTTLIQERNSRNNTLSAPEDANMEREKRREERRKKLQPSRFDIIAGKKLKQIIEQIQEVNKNSKSHLWCHDFRKMRQMDGVSEEKIKEALLWYKKYIGDDYIPEIYCGVTFRKKYNNGQLPRAIVKSKKPQREQYHDKETDYKDPKTNKWQKRDHLAKLRSKYFRTFPEQINDVINQVDLDVILQKEGMEAGEISSVAVSNG